MKLSRLMAPAALLKPALLALSLFLSANALAQSYPSKPLNMMVAWPAGGASDFVARLMAKEMGVALNQAVVVENLAGAGGVLGTNKAFAAPADGYQMVLSSPLDMILAPIAFTAAKYKAEDWRMVALIGRTDIMVVARKNLAANNMDELITLLKANSAKPLSYCSVGNGSLYHLIAEKFTQSSGTKALHVPYPGFPQCATDLAGGNIDFAFMPIGGPFPGFIDSGNFKAIGVLADKPAARFPNLQIISKVKGMEDVKFSVWAAVHAHASTPPEALQALNKAAYAAINKPEVKTPIAASGAVVATDALDLNTLQSLYLSEVKTYTAIANAVGVERK